MNTADWYVLGRLWCWIGAFSSNSCSSVKNCLRHTSHVTRHTSHVTRHTSHVTRHLRERSQSPTASDLRRAGNVSGGSQSIVGQLVSEKRVKRHTSHVTRHTSHVTRHTSPERRVPLERENAKQHLNTRIKPPNSYSFLLAHNGNFGTSKTPQHRTDDMSQATNTKHAPRAGAPELTAFMRLAPAAPARDRRWRVTRGAVTRSIYMSAGPRRRTHRKSRDTCP
jgi:hypothetical protein